MFIASRIMSESSGMQVDWERRMYHGLLPSLRRVLAEAGLLRAGFHFSEMRLFFLLLFFGLLSAGTRLFARQPATSCGYGLASGFGVWDGRAFFCGKEGLLGLWAPGLVATWLRAFSQTGLRIGLYPRQGRWLRPDIGPRIWHACFVWRDDRAPGSSGCIMASPRTAWLRRSALEPLPGPWLRRWLILPTLGKITQSGLPRLATSARGS